MKPEHPSFGSRPLYESHVLPAVSSLPSGGRLVIATIDHFVIVNPVLKLAAVNLKLLSRSSCVCWEAADHNMNKNIHLVLFQLS